MPALGKFKPGTILQAVRASPGQVQAWYNLKGRQFLQSALSKFKPGTILKAVSDCPEQVQAWHNLKGRQFLQSALSERQQPFFIKKPCPTQTKRRRGTVTILTNVDFILLLGLYVNSMNGFQITLCKERHILQFDFFFFCMSRGAVVI